jgi:hypothetical protein
MTPFTLTADEWRHLRAVINAEVRDDGARILLHRCIGAAVHPDERASLPPWGHDDTKEPA